MAEGGFFEGLSQAKRFLSGQRMLPDQHVVKYLTRLNLYAPLLQVGVTPPVIEMLLQQPNQLAEIVERTAQAYMDIPDETAAYAAATRTFGSSLVARGIRSGGAMGGASSAVGLLAWVAGAAWGSSEDCVDGVSQQWLRTHRKRMEEKLNAIKPYFHDGMDHVRSGEPQDDGVSLIGAPLNLPAAQVELRRRFVKIVFDWLMRHKDMSNANLLTIYPKIVCMCDNVLNQWDDKAKMEAGGVFYASIVEMAQVMTKCMYDVGWGTAIKAFGEYRGWIIDEMAPSRAGGKIGYSCKFGIVGTGGTDYYPCPDFFKQQLREYTLRGHVKTEDVAKQYAPWHIFLRATNVESLVRYNRFFMALAFGRRVHGTTEDLYYGPTNRRNAIWDAESYRQAHPELITATAGESENWTFPVLNPVASLALSPGARARIFAIARAKQVRAGTGAPKTEDEAANYLAEHTAGIEGQIRERALRRRNKIITWTLGGVAVVAAGGIIYLVLRDR
jgi:hypothetical protein